MKIQQIIPAAAAALLCWVGVALGQFHTLSGETRVDRSFEPSPRDCADVRWSQAALEAFPSIGSACQAVEERNGKTYVKFTGEVENVSQQGKRLTVDFEDGRDLTFEPSPNTVLYIDGEKTSFADLREGTELNFYVPEDRIQAELQPDIQRTAYVIVPIVYRTDQVAMADGVSTEPEMAAATMPDTASLWPLVGLAGALLVVIGGGLTLRRHASGRR